MWKNNSINQVCPIHHPQAIWGPNNNAAHLYNKIIKNKINLLFMYINYFIYILYMAQDIYVTQDIFIQYSQGKPKC